MEPEADNRPPKPSKPPYLFLIPVGLAVVGFVGYQTVRAGMEPAAHKYQYQLDTTQADQTTTQSSTSVSTVHGNVLTVHPHSSKPVRVAKADLKKAKPEASPSEGPSPSPAPSDKPTPTPAPSHAPKKPAKPQSETADPIAPEVAYEPIVRHPAPSRPANVHSRSLAAVPGRLASTTQDNSNPGSVSQPPENAPAATDAPAPVATDKPAVAEPVNEGPVDASDRVVEAKMTYAASPDYPDIAREQGAHGTSVVLVTVNQNGSITHMSIGSSSGSSTLDRSALAAARSSRYVPPKVDGKPAIETYRIVYDFAP